MTQPEHRLAERRHGERGFSLLEVVIAVAIVVLIGGSAFETAAQQPAKVRATVLGFAGLIAQARALAAVNDGLPDGGSGASIGVIRDGDTVVATLYRFRPARGAAHQPEVQPNAVPFRTTTAIAIDVDGRQMEPPFALFFSAAGHASAQAGFIIGESAPLAAEPACPATAGIGLTFHDARQSQRYALTCELAQLDLQTTAEQR